MLNANTAAFLDEILPVLETALSDLLTNVANKITEKFTYDELFPLNWFIKKTIKTYLK